MEMRRIATLETGKSTKYSPVADATAAIFRTAEPWLESHGYHHASAPRDANVIAQRWPDGSRGIYSTEGIYSTDGIHPTDRRVKMEMRRVATLETGISTASITRR
jgi:hypothetical protein